MRGVELRESQRERRDERIPEASFGCPFGDDGQRQGAHRVYNRQLRAGGRIRFGDEDNGFGSLRAVPLALNEWSYFHKVVFRARPSLEKLSFVMLSYR